MPIASRFGCWTSPVEVKTADYTVTTKDFGKTFTNRGDAGAIVFTLPAPAAQFNGCWVRFYCIVDENMSVTTAAGEQIVGHNNATADTITLGTTTEQIGTSMTMLCDGTSWLTIMSLGSETVTPTITDA